MGLRNAYLTLLEAILSSFKEVNFPTFNILLSFLTWKLKVASFFFSYSIYTLHWHCKNETKGAMTSFAFHTGPFQLQKDSTIHPWYQNPSHSLQSIISPYQQPHHDNHNHTSQHHMSSKPSSPPPLRPSSPPSSTNILHSFTKVSS